MDQQNDQNAQNQHGNQQEPKPAPSGPTPTGPLGGRPGAGGSQQQPSQEDTAPANFQLGALFTDGINITLPDHPDTQFDDNEFITLLASSISLSKAEKKRILDAVPKLKQWQVDELMTIFNEEKKKFAQLSKKHLPQLEKLAKQHYEDWKDLEMGQAQEGEKEEEKKKAEEIRKSLGL